MLSVLEGQILNEGSEMWEEVSGEVTIALPAGREHLLFPLRIPLWCAATSRI